MSLPSGFPHPSFGLQASSPPSVKVVCSNCKQEFRVSVKFAGTSGPCPRCHATIYVPVEGKTDDR